MNAEMTLDEAWAAAEAALPEGRRITSLWLRWDEQWVADSRSAVHPHIEGYGPTPATALQALTARLQENPR